MLWGSASSSKPRDPWLPERVLVVKAQYPPFWDNTAGPCNYLLLWSLRFKFNEASGALIFRVEASLSLPAAKKNFSCHQRSKRLVLRRQSRQVSHVDKKGLSKLPDVDVLRTENLVRLRNKPWERQGRVAIHALAKYHLRKSQPRTLHLAHNRHAGS